MSIQNHVFPVTRILSPDEISCISELIQENIKFNNKIKMYILTPSSQQPIESGIALIDKFLNIIRIDEIMTRNLLLGTLHDLYQNINNFNLFGEKGKFASILVYVMYLIGSCQIDEADKKLIEIKNYLINDDF
jgi:hypothetical protein